MKLAVRVILVAVMLTLISIGIAFVFNPELAAGIFVVTLEAVFIAIFVGVPVWAILWLVRRKGKRASRM